MKKHIALLLAFAFCAGAQASTVKWTLEGKSFTTSDGSAERASIYYVAVFLYENFSAVKSEISKLGSSNEETVANAVANLDGYTVSSGKTKATGASSGSFSSELPSVTPVSLFMVAFDAQQLIDAEKYIVSGEVVSDAFTLPDNPTNEGKFSASSFSSSRWTPVPEPSVAFMGLLGLGMLLKRRKA